jgi:hypothetical protein
MTHGLTQHHLMERHKLGLAPRKSTCASQALTNLQHLLHVYSGPQQRAALTVFSLYLLHLASLFCQTET